MDEELIGIKKTIAELENDGLIIDDYETFETYISKFNINTFIYEYSEMFLDDNERYVNVKSSDFIKLYEFDRNLSNHIFRKILIIEKIMNTSIVYNTIITQKITDHKLLSLDKNYLKQQIFPNIADVEPRLDFDHLLFKLVKYLDAGKKYKKYMIYDEKDDILKWKNIPLDVMCLAWSFATTFSFFIAANDQIRISVLKTFNVSTKLLWGFIDFIKNTINVRNLVSHNMALYNVKIKYQTQELFDLYKFLFNEEIIYMKLSHMIRIFSVLSGDEKLIEKTLQNSQKLGFHPSIQKKIDALFKV